MPAPAREDPVLLPRVLEEEFRVLHGNLPAEFPGEGSNPTERLTALFRAVHSLKTPRSAICFSGGGIRSATFALGLLQGLARHRLLGLFDYMSTVSGGGYLGSWLSAWIARSGGRLGQIEKDLGGADSDVVTTEPIPVGHLRAYSNFITPKLGALSADTWTVVTTVLRNVVLNWLLLVPIVGVVVMLPRLWMMALSLSPRPLTSGILLGFSIVLGILGLGYIALDMPSVGNARGSQANFLALCLAPVLAAVFLAVSVWAWSAPSVPAKELLHVYVALGVGFHLLALLMTWVRLRRAIRPTFILSTLATGALGGLGIWTLTVHVFPDPGQHLPLYAAFAPSLLLLLLLLLGALFVGITSRVTRDEDREWWSRAGGWVLISMLVWTTGAAIALFGPNLPAPLSAAISSAGGLSGVAVAVVGFWDRNRPKNGDGKEAGAKDLVSSLLLKLATPTFVLALFVAVSIASASLLAILTGTLDLVQENQRIQALLKGLGLFGALFVLAFVMSCFLDTNEFSLHSMYRNRLVRAYLGASTPLGSRPNVNPFTGFSRSDDLLVTDLAGQRPFHVLNLTLNVVNANNLAWQERKAESFTVTPLHAGSLRLGYRPSGRYGGGITLGTAATISGAAASPNMGYHSSPAVTFLMTFFNARLGCWLGNPGDAGWFTWFRTGPRLALRPIIAEALGRTDDRTPYVYLSDGGHFENLGLYEMVLRRCELILVSDAGSDSRFTFGDLGNAVRKIRVDLGIPIEFRGKTLSQTVSSDEGKYGAVADILYHCVDPGAPDGLLIYVKPSLNGTEPADIRNYKAMHPEFPHETTADQWFSESQFESYRMLGSHIIEEICGTVQNDLLAFGQQAEAYLGPPTVTPVSAVPPPKPLVAAVTSSAHDTRAAGKS